MIPVRALRAAISALPSNDRVFADSLAAAPSVLGVVTGFAPQLEAKTLRPPSNSAAVLEIGGDPRPERYARDETQRVADSLTIH